MPPSRDEPLITTTSGLLELCDHLRSQRRFAFDTEFVSEETFEPVLGLIQVATAGRLVAIDPLALEDIEPFWQVLLDPDVTVVMHAAGEDLRICRLRNAALPQRVVDVQLAAGLVGHVYPISLGNLVRQELGLVLPGGETRTDWRRRPLSDAQLRYALDDVRHLLPLADRLETRLERWGRTSWADEEYRGLLEAVERRNEAERWRRLPGLHQLSRRGLEVARRIYEWRGEEARRSNRPVRQVLRDDLLVGIARRQPATKRDLEALREFNRPHLLARSRNILACVAEAMEVPDRDLPEHAERREEGPGLSMVVSLLSATLNQCAAEQKVATALVGTTGDLKDLVRWYTTGQPAEHVPSVLNSWRGELCGQTLLDVLSGRRSLRVVDPGADVPVALDPIE